MPRLDIYVNYKLSASVKLGDGDTVIGRDVRCEVQIPNPRVSRRQAVISGVDGGHELHHVGTNPTMVNEVPVTDSRRLLPGDVVIVADYILAYQSDDTMPSNVAATVIGG